MGTRLHMNLYIYNYKCANFGAFITKCTIISLSRRTTLEANCDITSVLVSSHHVIGKLFSSELFETSLEPAVGVSGLIVGHVWGGLAGGSKHVLLVCGGDPLRLPEAPQGSHGGCHC